MTKKYKVGGEKLTLEEWKAKLKEEADYLLGELLEYQELDYQFADDGKHYVPLNYVIEVGKRVEKR